MLYSFHNAFSQTSYSSTFDCSPWLHRDFFEHLRHIAFNKGSRSSSYHPCRIGTVKYSSWGSKSNSILQKGNSFDPSEVRADVGDIIGLCTKFKFTLSILTRLSEFRFYPTNHSVARAAYGYPCIPYEAAGLAMEGFWSGYNYVNVMLSDASTHKSFRMTLSGQLTKLNDGF